MAINFGHLSELCDQISEMERRIRDAAQAEFKPALKDAILVLRENVPQLSSFRWNQYVPGFNDGDPCEFTMEEVMFKFRDHDGEGDDCAGYYDTWSIERDDKLNGVINEEQRSILKELSQTIDSLSGACELAFGTNSTVTVDIDSGELTLEDYDCGF